MYFPSLGGASCTEPTFSAPAHFRRLTVYKVRFFGIWAENLVDVHFEGARPEQHPRPALCGVHS